MKRLTALALILWLVPAAHAEEAAPLDLTQVAGIEHFPGSPAERAMLAKNQFVVLPRYENQLFSYYVGGKLPYYVTCDSVHRTYHLIFEEALAEIERLHARQLGPFLQRLYATLAALPEETLGRSEALNYVAVSARLVAVEAVGSDGKAVGAAVKVIEDAGGLGACPVFGVDDDFSLYAPRGLYAGDATLERYFRSMTWLGRRSLRLTSEAETHAALLIAQALHSDPQIGAFHKQLDETLQWLIGPGDDLGVGAYAPHATKAGWQTRLPAIQAALRKLPDAEINAGIVTPNEWSQRVQKGMYLFPQRRTPDAWLFQQLNDTVEGHRLPASLEAAAALGSDHADGRLRAGGLTAAADSIRSLAAGFEQRMGRTHYAETLRATRQILAPTAALNGGQPAVVGSGKTPVLPARHFQSAPWRDRVMTTGLANWASLRHAFMLHQKVAQFSLGMALPPPPGVVEPVPDYYAALRGLASETRDRLKAAMASAPRPDRRAAVEELVPAIERQSTGALQQSDVAIFMKHDQLTEQLLKSTSSRKSLAAQLRTWLDTGKGLGPAQQAVIDGPTQSVVPSMLEAFLAMVTELEQIARKHLRGEPISEEDKELIGAYGETSGPLNLFFGNSYLSPDRPMALVATVGGDPERGAHRHVGTGDAMLLFVVLELADGTHQLYRGGVYSYYEFDETSPMTDAAWHTRVSTRQTGPLPAWTRSYVPAVAVSDVAKRLFDDAHISKALMLDVDATFDLDVGRALFERFKNTDIGDGHGDTDWYTWMTRALARYRDTELRESLVSTTFAKLRPLACGDYLFGSRGVSSALLHLAAGLTTSDADIRRLLGWIVDPPQDAHADYPILLARVLRRQGSDLEPEFLALMTHASLNTRRAATDYLALRASYGNPTQPKVIATALARLLETESDQAFARQTLERMRNLGARLHAAPVKGVLLWAKSEDPKARETAATVLGHIGSQQAAPVLLTLLGDAERRVVYSAIGALGKCLRDSKGGEMRVAAVRGLGKLLDDRAAPTAEALAALALIGGSRAQTFVETVALDASRSAPMRMLAIDALASFKAAALPTLYRLCFDETSAGESVFGDTSRLCDEAAKAVESALGDDDQSFGANELPRPPGAPPESGAAAEGEARLKRCRDQARKAGHAPKGK